MRFQATDQRTAITSIANSQRPANVDNICRAVKGESEFANVKTCESSEGDEPRAERVANVSPVASVTSYP